VAGVKPTLGLYVLLPDTATVPTVVPPLVHVVGAVAWGPNTVNVTVPVAPAVAPVSVALREPDPIALPVASVEGAAVVSAVTALATDVEVIPLPQVLAEELSLASPL
jgi:hypothetical protein